MVLDTYFVTQRIIKKKLKLLNYFSKPSVSKLKYLLLHVVEYV